ncbi:MAG: hypothetical protein ACP5XB_16120 [Isosphaeraceae bacterium]
MDLDIRLPIGLLFTLLGGLLVLYGLATHFSQPAMYQRSLEINVNLWWGLTMLVFGGIMIWFGRRVRAGRSPKTN